MLINAIILKLCEVEENSAIELVVPFVKNFSFA